MARGREPLSSDEIEFFRRHGYLVVGRIIDPDATARLRGRLSEFREKGFEHDDPAVQVTRYGETGALSIVFNLWRADSRFRALFFDRRIARWAAQLLDCQQVSLMSDETLVKQPGQEGYLDWHQDWTGYPDVPTDFVTCWIALDEVALENGTMEVADSSHLLGPYLPNSAEDEWDPLLRQMKESGAKPLPEVESTQITIAPILLEPGACSFHHALTWHRSRANSSPAPRNAIAKRFRPLPGVPAADGASGGTSG